MKTPLFRFSVILGAALALSVAPVLIGQGSLTPSAQAQSKGKSKSKSFRGPASRGTSRSSSRRSSSRSTSSRSRSRSRSITSSRRNNNLGIFGGTSIRTNRSFNNSSRSRARSPFSSRGSRRNSGLSIILGASGIGIGSSRYSNRRLYNDRPFGWRQRGWRSSSWKARFYEPPYSRASHRLWGRPYYHDQWGWYYSDVVGRSTLVFVDREPDNCEYIEYQGDILLECGRLLYRPTLHRGEQVYEIVDD